MSRAHSTSGYACFLEVAFRRLNPGCLPITSFSLPRCGQTSRPNSLPPGSSPKIAVASAPPQLCHGRGGPCLARLFLKWPEEENVTTATSWLLPRGGHRLWELQGGGGSREHREALVAQGVSDTPARCHLCLLPPGPYLQGAPRWLATPSQVPWQ